MAPFINYGPRILYLSIVFFHLLIHIDVFDMRSKCMSVFGEACFLSSKLISFLGIRTKEYFWNYLEKIIYHKLDLSICRVYFCPVLIRRSFFFCFRHICFATDNHSMNMNSCVLFLRNVIVKVW